MGQPASAYRFILLPSLVGLVCYACSQTPNPSQTSDIDANNLAIAATEPVTKPVSPSEPEPIEAAQSTVDPDISPAYQAGINLASSAYQLSQSAISPDDWGLVASKWQRAVEQLKQVNSDSNRYEAAQAKITEYNRHAEQAAREVESLKTTAKTTVTATKLPATAKPSALTPNVPSSAPGSSITSSSSSTSNRIIVPVVRRLHGTPVVQVTFNGTKTYDMILDTGASRTLITRAMANELAVIATERMVAATASESEVVFELGRVESISMGDITLSNARVSIGDSVSIGLLGNDFLNGYDITIRGRENVVELIRS